MKKYAIIGPFILIIVWAVISRCQLVDAFFLPGPITTISKLLELIKSGVIIDDLVSTLGRVGLSFVIALIIGLPLGLILGMSEKIYRSVEFIIDFFRSTPATALFPLFLLIFGVTDKSKIAVAAFASTIIIIFNTAYGVMHAKKSRILAAKIMGANRAQIFYWILFWESLPQTFIGLRSAISLSLVIVIVTEMFIGTPFGLGKMINDSQIIYEISTMYAIILLVGAIGYLLNLLLILIEGKTIHWRGR
ncbi:taurine ABC transporter permease [Candidatus Falkowbacteria bacterium RIFOXYB2_FULL_38_15]|uniref:Taurine ABC transporter permease n=1 Tax=Candidatus Falkowbacteria bacterium RIFOXYA2_FULL_38_12 TaxID=1797993 RepID=A0A1F5S4E9_9BACT|nr:MAG: taurine ABC transporter permease [Candidatus Falkowbacteria bacterium RIFOXYA2_FULL_38_12]OGF33709.1 MAG: taurine ABC transporter permease [Candidatus Falkowbacteria bacterium RIFOXYB2_FULL_38_15]OGF42282.1 MAG: taurine ABC transporter permease [Candidatus Falkowbacteria bacterium RIFOXYD2_FULL_39_16]